MQALFEGAVLRLPCVNRDLAAGPAMSTMPRYRRSARKKPPAHARCEDRARFLGDDQIVTALREGRTPDGHVLRPSMPVLPYRSMSDNDASAFAIYLKSLPAVKHLVAESTYKVPTSISIRSARRTRPGPFAGESRGIRRLFGDARSLHAMSYPCLPRWAARLCE
jgi:hypothetical protein